MKVLYLNVSVLMHWEVPDDFDEDDAQAKVDDFLEENQLTDICNDVEWDLLPGRVSDAV